VAGGAQFLKVFGLAAHMKVMPLLGLAKTGTRLSEQVSARSLNSRSALSARGPTHWTALESNQQGSPLRPQRPGDRSSRSGRGAKRSRRSRPAPPRRKRPGSRVAHLPVSCRALVKTLQDRPRLIRAKLSTVANLTVLPRPTPFPTTRLLPSGTSTASWWPSPSSGRRPTRTCISFSRTGRRT